MSTGWPTPHNRQNPVWPTPAGGAPAPAPTPYVPPPSVDTSPPPMDAVPPTVDPAAQAAEDAKNAQRQDALARLKQLFDQYGLPGLADWAWNELTGGKSEDQVTLEMYDQPIFKKAYPMIDAMRNAGLTVPSLAEIRNNLTEFKRLQRSYGHNVSDDPAAYTNLFTGQVSPSEFEKRLDNYDKLRNVYGPHLRQNFEQHAGIPNLSDEQLYELLSGQNQDLARKYAQMTGTAHTPFTFETIENAFNRAVEEEKATAKTGGETAVGIGSTEEERILRERQTAI